jgi:arginase
MVAQMREWVAIGVPTSAGAHHAGQDRAPAALRQAGLLSRLREAGVQVTDSGDLPGAIFAADPDHPSARNQAAVVQVAGAVACAVAAAAADGRIPLVIGGDCTITVGAVAGLRRVLPDLRLAYVDGDADLGTPEATGSGIFDSMGVAHLLGRGAPELAGLDGSIPLLDPSRIALVGADPREIDDAGRGFLASNGVFLAEAPELRADPGGVAERALAAVGDGPLLVHFDVDVVDSGELPLGNFPHYSSGVRLADAVRCLQVLRAHPGLAGLVLTEVNPSYDPGGGQLSRYIEGIVSVLAA